METIATATRKIKGKILLRVSLLIVSSFSY
jgi:hypothetical protein